MWQPNDLHRKEIFSGYGGKYKSRHEWNDNEDNALKLSWGRTAIEEIAEAFMCSCYDVTVRAKILGLVPPGYNILTAKKIENMVKLFDDNKSINHVAELYNLPDEIYRYSVVPSGVDQKVSRDLQEYYAKNNDNQLDMFGESAEGDNDED